MGPITRDNTQHTTRQQIIRAKQTHYCSRRTMKGCHPCRPGRCLFLLPFVANLLALSRVSLVRAFSSGGWNHHHGGRYCGGAVVSLDNQHRSTSPKLLQRPLFLGQRTTTATKTTKRPVKSTQLALLLSKTNQEGPTISRRGFGSTSLDGILSAAAAAVATTALTRPISPALADDLTVIKTPSGLKYIDLQEGTGRTPAYGNFCTIAYKAYIKLPGSGSSSGSAKPQQQQQPQQYDSSNAYLIKHGNGRTIAGLDEGLHTMRAGGVRRMLIPPKLGFVDSGLGPLPDSPWNRNQLNRLLDQMVVMAGGTVIYEVTLKQVIEDEADQGYYTDDSLTPEDFETLRENLRIQGNENLKQQAVENSLGVTGQERLL